jgi:hypothetical protein
MRKVEDEVIHRVVTHDVDTAIWNLGIILSNSEWCCLVEILDMLLSLEV